MNIPDEFPLELTGLISLLSKGLSRVFSSTIIQRHQFFSAQASLMVQLSHPNMTTGKTIVLPRQTFVGEVMSLLLNTPSRLVIIFLPRSKHLLISWLQSPSAVILEVGCSPWGLEELDTTERLHFRFSLSCIGEGNGNPLQCSCLENPRDAGSLVGCRLWGCTESDTTEVT